MAAEGRPPAMPTLALPGVVSKSGTDWDTVRKNVEFNDVARSEAEARREPGSGQPSKPPCDGGEFPPAPDYYSVWSRSTTASSDLDSCSQAPESTRSGESGEGGGKAEMYRSCFGASETSNSSVSLDLEEELNSRLTCLNIKKLSEFQAEEEDWPGSPSSCMSRSHMDLWSDKSETLIIFDWDDTLCPTTHQYINPDCAEQHIADLERHAKVTEHLLRAAAELGRVSIVTMAGTGWVEDCMQKLMPSLPAVLQELSIPIELAREGVPISSKREAFAECREPSHFLKRRTMARVIRNFYNARRGKRTAEEKKRSWKNILSIGDSVAEQYALQDLVFKKVQRDRHGRWKECRCKTVKLKIEPTLTELSAQLVRMLQLLPTLVYHDGDVDIEVDEDDIDLGTEDLQGLFAAEDEGPCGVAR